MRTAVLFESTFFTHDLLLFVTEKTEFNEGYTPELEKWIDCYHNQLPPLKNFILPVSTHEI